MRIALALVKNPKLFMVVFSSGVADARIIVPLKEFCQSNSYFTRSLDWIIGGGGDFVADPSQTK